MALDNQYCVLMWKSRRMETWRAMRGWIPCIPIFGLATAGIFNIAATSKYPWLLAGLGCCTVAGALVSFYAIIRAVEKHYRCPRCNEVPMSGSWSAGTGGIGYQRGVELAPKSCPSCKAPFVE